MQKQTGGGVQKTATNAAQQMKPQQPKHNMTVVELQTPHQKLPGVQKYTPEDLKLMVERAKNFPQVHDGFYLKVINYDFQVDEWELETGNSQPHSDESKLNLKPKSAVLTAEQRRALQAKKSKEAREQMDQKFDIERNPKFKRPETANIKKTAQKSDKKSQDQDEEEKENNIVASQPEVISDNEDEEENAENQDNDAYQDEQANEEQNENQDNEDEEEQEQEVKKQQHKSGQSSVDKLKKNTQNQAVDRKATNKVQSKKTKQEVDEEEDDNNYRVQMISKEKQKEQQQKQKYKKNLQKEDIMNDGDDEDEINNSFEKMSISQAQDNASNISQSKVNNKQAVKKGPYKSDVANMMSSMFSEISGFDTDI